MQVPEIVDDALDPADKAWAAVPSEKVPLVPVPIEEQPNEYIRTAWRTRPYGRVGEVDVAAVQRGERLLVRLEWDDSDEPNTEFLDGAGVFFPDAGDSGAPLTIGSHGAPVRLWAWRDRTPMQEALPAARELVASGPGAFRAAGLDAGDGENEGARPDAVSALSGGRWAVVIAGDLARAAAAGRMGVVVWDGSNDERAGIGAVSPNWVPLTVK
jgi:DMSO reductase family type II enzyme heme b subunit